MHYRPLGRTGLSVSVVAFGAGPVSTLMVGDDADRAANVVRHAIARGINWFDTAAGYGDGRSETNLGLALADCEASDVHVATKVRLRGDELHDMPAAIRRSVAASLARLRRPHVTLLQLHNSLTARRDDEPTSLTPDDVLRTGGIADTFDELRRADLVRHVGLTGLGQPAAMREVIRSGRFDTVQTPYHLLNASAGEADASRDPADSDYGGIFADCAAHGMGVFAIRVFAGGALLGNPPSPHTLKTPFFPLDLYCRDLARAEQLRQSLPAGRTLYQEALRFSLGHPTVTSAIIGFADEAQIDDAVDAVTSS